MGFSHKLPNRYRANVYANLYPSNSTINRISMVTNSSCIVAGGVYTWVRHKAIGDDAVQLAHKYIGSSAHR
jgi:hypothetical protein